MTTTSKGFTLFEQSLINPDVQLNEVLLGLESMLFANPKDKDLTTPPGSESDFDLYIVRGDATAISSFTASTNTITFESTVDTVYTEGKKFTVKSATDSDNNGEFTVVSSSGAAVVVAEDIVDEGSSPAIAYIAGGDWNGHVDDLAIYYNEQYYFKTPLEGWSAYLQDEDSYCMFDGIDWGITFSFSGVVSIVQSKTAGAVPVLHLTQADLSEEFIRFTGESAADNSQSLLDAANLTTPGSIVGWVKVNIQDVASSGAITDGNYFIPFYSTPTA